MKNIYDEYGTDTIFEIEETDSELLFKFKAKDDNKIIPILNPKISGASISPFSARNLPKTKYVIPDKDLAMYKNIISKIPRERILNITQVGQI